MISRDLLEDRYSAKTKQTSETIDSNNINMVRHVDNSFSILR